MHFCCMFIHVMWPKKGALIDLVHQYLGFWDKSESLYKDQNYKDVKWTEIVTFLEIPSKYAFMITCIYLFDDFPTGLH